MAIKYVVANELETSSVSPVIEMVNTDKYEVNKYADDKIENIGVYDTLEDAKKVAYAESEKDGGEVELRLMEEEK